MDFADLSSWDSDLADLTKEHHFRLEPYFRKAVQNFMSRHQREFVETEDGVPKEFWVSFYGLPVDDRLRDLKTSKIGKLVSFVGTCTRTSEVMPSKQHLSLTAMILRGLAPVELLRSLPLACTVHSIL